MTQRNLATLKSYFNTGDTPTETNFSDMFDSLAIFSSGAGAPATVPDAIGHLYLDETNDVLYAATGTASASDWQVISNVIWFDAGGSSSAARPTSSTKVLVIWTNHGSSEPTNAQSHDIIAGPGTGVVYVNTQTGTSYTLVLGDAGKAVDMNNASVNTLTIPTNASVAFAVGTCISVTQLGAGATTVTGDTGVTVNGTPAGGVAIGSQYAGVTIRKTATDTWIAQGDFT